MLEKYLPRTEFDSYEDFKKNYTVNAPENFNFGFDIVDGIARQYPDKLAMLYVDKHHQERRFTFKDIKDASNQCANYFTSLGIRR